MKDLRALLKDQLRKKAPRKPKPLPDPELLRIKEAAAALGVAYQTIYRWVYEGRLKTVRLGRAVRIPKSEIKRLASDGLAKEKE